MKMSPGAAFVGTLSAKMIAQPHLRRRLRPAAGAVLIDVGVTVKEDAPQCKSATLAATFTARYIMPYENNLGIVICRGLRKQVPEAWKHIRFMI